jgi:hypothetical protein
MKNLVIAALFLFAMSSCKKDVSELPAPSDTGENIFGAKVNGDYWVPQKFGVVPANNLLEGRITPEGVFINARNFSSSPTETEFELFIKDVNGPGVYPLNSNTGHYPNHSASYGYFIKRRFNPINEWITTSQYTGQITVTKYDAANHIIAGTFSFTAKEITDSAEPLTVTEGRFDVRLQ